MVERLLVLLAGEVIGHLERTSASDDPTFSYTARYVSVGDVALSAKLPLREQVHPTGKVKPFLFGLLPENVQARAASAARYGVHMDDAFGLLADIGWDCAGAVQFCREEDLAELRNRTGDHRPISETQIADRIRELIGGEPSWAMPGEHWSLGGQQEKFALARINGEWHTAHGSSATTHIFKPGIKELHHQALIEHVTMRAAAAVGVDIAHSTFTRFDDQWAIVVERFDRVVQGKYVQRLHQEDFVQACGRMPEYKYEDRGGPQLTDMMRVAKRETADLDDARRALADFLIVNLVAGAPDGHSKNISLLRAPNGNRVAPLYDLATGLAYDAENVDRSVALSIGGQRNPSRIRRHQWEKAAGTLGLEADLLIERMSMMAEAFPDAFEDSLSELREVPGIDELRERALPRLKDHTRKVLERL